MRGQRATGKLARNNYHHGSCGPSLLGKTSSEMIRCTFGDTNVFFYFPKFGRNRDNRWMHFSCICHTVFRMFSCLHINWQPFYLRQLLKFHPFDWLMEYIFKPWAKVLTTKWYRSNQCLAFPLCYILS